MKVLTHNGVLLSLPYTSLPEGVFEQLDGQGTAAVGVVGELEERTVRRTALQAANAQDTLATAAEIVKDLGFISRALSGVNDGAEIRLECRGTKMRLVVPQEDRARQAPIVAGDRIAFNGHVKPKTMLNAHGTVESVKGEKATIKLDAGDRRRVMAATGKDYPESIPAPLSILDKLDAEES